MYVSSRTLPRFLSVFLYSTLSFPLSFPGKPSNFPGSEPSRGWFAIGPKKAERTGKSPRCFAGIPEKPGFTWKIPGILIPGVFAGFLEFASDFAPDQLSDSGKLARVARMEHLVSMEISGNAKCWGPSVFPLGCRKLSYRPNPSPSLLPPSLLPLSFVHNQQPTTTTTTKREMYVCIEGEEQPGPDWTQRCTQYSKETVRRKKTREG